MLVDCSFVFQETVVDVEETFVTLKPEITGAAVSAAIVEVVKIWSVDDVMFADASADFTEK